MGYRARTSRLTVLVAGTLLLSLTPATQQETVATAQSITQTIRLGFGGAAPISVAVDRTRNRAYVANSNSNVTVIDGTSNQAVAAIKLTSVPRAISVNEATGRVYATTTDNAVSVIDGQSN